MTAPSPRLQRADPRLCLLFPLLVLGACVKEHPEIPVHDDKPIVVNKEVVAKVATDIANSQGAAGNPAAAIPFYRKSLQDNPNQPKVEVSLGTALLQTGSPGEAAEVFRKVISRFPQDAGAQNGLGIALVQLGKPAAALDPLRKAAAAAPDARLYRTLGVAENLLGQNAQAEADYAQGLKLAPDDPGLNNNLGLSMALSGNFDGAIAVLRRAAKGPNATPQTRQNLALALGLAGRTTEAAQIARADLDEPSVQSNLAYYAVLRSMSPRERAEALLKPVAAAPQPILPQK